MTAWYIRPSTHVLSRASNSHEIDRSRQSLPQASTGRSKNAITIPLSFPRKGITTYPLGVSSRRKRITMSGRAHRWQAKITRSRLLTTQQLILFSESGEESEGDRCKLVRLFAPCYSESTRASHVYRRQPPSSMCLARLLLQISHLCYNISNRAYKVPTKSYPAVDCSTCSGPGWPH